MADQQLSSAEDEQKQRKTVSVIGRTAAKTDQYVKLNQETEKEEDLWLWAVERFCSNSCSLFQTTVGTLTKYDSMLKAMFSGRMEVLRDRDGYALIDRCGKHFGLILNFLREGTVPLPECRMEVHEIIIEAKYYLLQELVELCYSWLSSLERDQAVSSFGVCNVPIVVSKKQVELIVQSCSGRPVIELLLNRQNNKYSYNASSDENFLRNQELFDKLILRFNNRVLFIKNIGIGSPEICQWTFYGSANRKVEVCCTSIVYATDKKQTKVEFPEARIYEEALNVLLTFDQDTSGVCVRCKGANGGGAMGAKWDAAECAQQLASTTNANLNKLLAPEFASIAGNGRIDWRLEQLALGTLLMGGGGGERDEQRERQHPHWMNAHHQLNSLISHQQHSHQHQSSNDGGTDQQQQQPTTSSLSSTAGGSHTYKGSHQKMMSESDD